MRDYARLDAFLDDRFKEIYPEPSAEPHISIINRMVPEFIETHKIAPGMRVLDVGCGEGLAMELFREHGCETLGVGFGGEAETARAKGFEVVESDMSFLDLDEASFDVVWCRHVVEHSIFPFFTLSEMFRLLKSGGSLYMEVPAIETASQHETNPNHYSVMPKDMWASLLHRLGFTDLKINEIAFNVEAGPDKYLMYTVRKP